MDRRKRRDRRQAGGSGVHFSGRRRSVLAFVMLLSFSRGNFIEFVQQQDLSTLRRCHLLAFEAFGGAPKRNVYGNLMTVLI